MTRKTTLILLPALLFCCNIFAQRVNTAKLDSLFQVLADKDKYMGSIAISANGELLYTKAIGKADIATNKPATTQTEYRIGSISKMFTSCLVFKAVEEHKLSLSQTIDKYFPAIENAGKITIGDLLSHRSGIHNFTDDENYLTYNTEAKTEQQMIDIIAKGKSDFEPGSKASYSNSNYVLLSYILEKTYKKPYKELLNARIIKPLGLKHTYFGGKTNLQNNESYSYSFTGKWNKESETDLSIPMGAGSVLSTPSDLVVFIEALFANKIISNESLQQMTTIKDGYGMGIFQVPFHSKKGFGHTGGIDGFSSAVAYFPADKVSVAITSNGGVYDNNDIVIAALSDYYGMPYEIPAFNTVALQSSDLDKYLGEYSSPDLPLKISVTKDGNKLIAQATGQSAFPLDATETDKFEFLQAGIKLEFLPAEKKMILKQGGGKFTFTRN
ncbi:beta-lactamase family protein [Taibaiella lutea]|uniref:Beta-lactamase family protein n=1 Tax=Taibaiella lutea TaxID=2608001 RepID=A0A5M6CGI9_9BACT|nr:serine hydrolase domain-containing protein [Taibaiella lutea]KAA5533550.1 beta-lactamase family protein [Taibaiella lutea]